MKQVLEDGCPEGMYPMTSTYEPNYCDSFEEFKEWATGAPNVLNLPISYFYDSEENYFTLVFVMPRKDNSTWSLRLTNPDIEQVLAWLNPWLKQEINKWFGWKEVE